jgi:hypothetical protein
VREGKWGKWVGVEKWRRGETGATPNGWGESPLHPGEPRPHPPQETGRAETFHETGSKMGAGLFDREIGQGGGKSGDGESQKERGWGGDLLNPTPANHTPRPEGWVCDSHTV